MIESRSAQLRRIREILVERFPRTFVPRRILKKPLALGIREMLIEMCPDIDEYDINDFLRDYTFGASYRSVCMPGAPRIGLDGDSVGIVSIKHARMAGETLMRLAAKGGRSSKTMPLLAADIARALMTRNLSEE